MTPTPTTSRPAVAGEHEPLSMRALMLHLAETERWALADLELR